MSRGSARSPLFDTRTTCYGPTDLHTVLATEPSASAFWWRRRAILGWKGWISGISPRLYASSKGSVPALHWKVVEFFRYFVFDDPSWDYSRYALSRWERDTKRIAS